MLLSALLANVLTVHRPPDTGHDPVLAFSRGVLQVQRRTR